jgi:hypothetical protein
MVIVMITMMMMHGLPNNNNNNKSKRYQQSQKGTHVTKPHECAAGGIAQLVDSTLIWISTFYDPAHCSQPFGYYLPLHPLTMIPLTDTWSPIDAPVGISQHGRLISTLV